MTLVYDFVAKVQAIYTTGDATEHSYRCILEVEALLGGQETDITALNEPKQMKCGTSE